MIGYSDFKELASWIGVPATVIIGVTTAFNLGLLPSVMRDLHSTNVLAEPRMTQHEKEVGQLMRQHTEQMRILNQALKEICLNTAKNEIRSYKCAELDGTLSDKQ